MRIKAVSIFNYKGLARVEAEDLHEESVITITGRNGTGKSLVLEAIVSLWTDRLYRSSDNVGPWADHLDVGVEVDFTEEEWGRIDDWHIRFSGGPAHRDSTEFRTRFTRAGSVEYVSRPSALETVRNAGFQAENRFGSIDFLPATRLMSSARSQSVDLAMLGADRVEQERAQSLEDSIVNRSAMSLPNIGNYLATLDYQNYLADRQGVPIENEYERMAHAFESATGKTLLPPVLDRTTGSTIQIQLPEGHTHGLSGLSTGEQEMLAMTYFVRRLSASGGVLCLDEPEQHLHPTLQAALFSSMHDLSGRAQVLVVSHSVKLIAAAPQSGLLQLSAAEGLDTNQISRATDDPTRVELLGLLGVSQADVFQSDAILVVEGSTDARWLPVLFPVEVGRLRIIQAGSASQLAQTDRILRDMPSSLPWLCVRDRDLLSDDDVAMLTTQHPSVFVWPRRAIESMLLESALIAAVTAAVGAPVDSATIDSWLREIANESKEDVLEAMVDAELTRRFPAPAAAPSTGRFEKMRQQLNDYATVNAARALAIEDVLREQRRLLDDRWDEDWKKLVNPKPVIAGLLKRVGTFKSVNDFTLALLTRAREEEEVRPEGFNEFKRAIDDLLSPTT
ncbi:ATP-dependent endonuclease [uncultured Microbacterium sp.]|uniref:ATP-dependent nuclease n=1 Tax=uncultured Microbacterium sp. TaxID=191216 RepID=UPI0025E76C2D|nr:ATP-binding protein [uncultured Microbacterium sp.]